MVEIGATVKPRGLRSANGAAVTTFMGGAEFAGDAVAGNKIIQLAATSLAEPPRQLPLDVRDFIGRGEALATLDALVDDREHDRSPVIVTITGMPGVGKTALAIRWSHRIADRFPDGHLFIDLRGYSERAALSPEEALGQALRALGVPSRRIPTDTDELAALYRTQLAARQMLVVLDDAASSLQVRPLIPGTSSCLVVVTSRNHLEGLVAIGEDLGGAVGATFDLSYRGLSDELRRAFRLLGLIEGPTFTSAATGALLAVTPEAAAQLLHRLHAANLLQAVRQDRYRLHELLREYARRRSAADDQLVQESAIQRLATWYLSTAQQAGRFLDRYRRTIRQELTEPPDNVDPVERKRQLNWFVLERANLMAVIRQASRFRWDQLTWKLADAVYDFLELRRHSVDNLEAHRLGLQAAQRERHHLAQFFMYRHIALSYRELGQYRLAFVEASCAHEISRRIQDRYGEACALADFARVHYPIGEYKEALWAAQEALRIRRDIGDRHGEATTLDTLSIVHMRLSQYQEAWNHAEAALPIHRALGDRRGEGETLDNLARIYKGWGRHKKALSCAERALAIRRTLGDRHGEAETLALLGALHLSVGRLPLGQRHVDGALRIFRKIADPHGEGKALGHLSAINRRLGRYADAMRAALEALDVFQELGDPQGEAETLITLARVQRRIGLEERAVNDAQRALAVTLKIGNRWGEGSALDALALAHLGLRHFDVALGHAERALECFREIR